MVTRLFTLCLFVAASQLVVAEDSKPTKLPSKRVSAQALSESSDSVSPGILESYKEELYKLRKAEDESKELELSSGSIDQNADVERQMTIRKAQIVELRRHQEDIISKLKMMQVEFKDYSDKIAALEGRFAKAETKREEFLQDLEKERDQLEDKKQKFEEAVAALTKRHERTSKEISSTMVQNLKIRSELANLGANIETLDAQVANLRAEEMKSKAELVVIQKQIDDRKAKRAVKLEELAKAENRVKSAVNDQTAAKEDLAKTERSLAEFQARFEADINRLEGASLNAQRSKIQAEAGRLRVEAEIEKLKNFLAMMKRANGTLSASAQSAEIDVMKAQVAMEAVRTELSQQLASGHALDSKKQIPVKIAETSYIPERSIASDMTSTSSTKGSRVWLAKTECQIRTRPRSASPSTGIVQPSQKLLAVKGPGEWIRLTGGGYVRQECGNFQP